MIAYYSVAGNETQLFIKTFKKNPENMFVLYTDQLQKNVENVKNITLDSHGKLQEIKIVLFKMRRSSFIGLKDIKFVLYSDMMSLDTSKFALCYSEFLLAAKKKKKSGSVLRTL